MAALTRAGTMIVSGNSAITPFNDLNPETEQVFGLWTITKMEEFL
jgi:hypothetical protein